MSRKTWFWVMSAVICLAFTSCTKQAGDPSSVGMTYNERKTESPEHSAEAGQRIAGDTEDSWKRAYIDYIASCNPEGIDSFDLIYLDQDDIPELVIIGKYSGYGSIILNYADGKVHDTNLSRLQFSYIERENLLLNYGGVTGVYFDYIFSIIDGELTEIATGDYEIMYVEEAEEDGEEVTVYQYMWNHKMVSEEEYNQELNLIYDQSKARYCQEPGIPLDKITEVIMNY